MKKLVATLSIASAALITAQAQAWEAGDMFVRGGVVNVSPDASSNGVAIPALGIAPIDGTSVDVDDNTQLGLTFTYMVSSNFGVEVLAATPFKHDITADLSAAGIGVAPVGETTHLPPTVSAVWYPMGSTDVFKPYVGAGVNYTVFFDEEVDPALEALTGSLAGAAGPVPLDMDLSSSLGMALQAGFDWELDSKWHLNASVRWIDISTDAKLTNPDLGTVITVDNVDIDPWVYQINIGYEL